MQGRSPAGSGASSRGFAARARRSSTWDGGATRTFVIPLTVPPDWPTHEPLRLTAELNGVDDLATGLLVKVDDDLAKAAS